MLPSESEIARQANAAELPARGGIEEIAISRANVIARRGARSAAQHELIAHELTVVLAERARQRMETGIGSVRRSSPLPDIAKHLFEPRRVRNVLGMQPIVVQKVASDRQVCRSDLPFRFRRESGTGPMRECIRFVVAQVAHGSARLQRLET